MIYGGNGDRAERLAEILDSELPEDEKRKRLELLGAIPTATRVVLPVEAKVQPLRNDFARVLAGMKAPELATDQKARAARPERGQTDLDVYASEAKWGATVLQRGFVIVPLTLLERRAELGIQDNTEVVMLLALLAHQWKADERPWPSQRRLGQLAGLRECETRRVLCRLRKRGLLSWTARYRVSGFGRTTNEYDLGGLKTKLVAICEGT